MVYMPVQKRREQARETAFELLQSGVPVADLTLRMIAERQGTPLPTLTYAYQSVTDLLDELLLTVEGPIFDAIGDRGLAAELDHFLEVSDAAADADPALEELSAYAIRRTGELGAEGFAAHRIAGTVEMITAIREKSGERYRLTVDEFMSWQAMSAKHGMKGLRTTKIQEYRAEEVCVDCRSGERRPGKVSGWRCTAESLVASPSARSGHLAARGEE